MQTIPTRHRRRRLVRACVVTLALTGLAPALASAQQAHRHSRDDWQKPAEVIAALGAGPGTAVADLGAGAGYFTFHLARAVGPQGRVFAIDVDSGALRRLRDTVARAALSQVTVIEGSADDPRLAPRSIDAALIVNAYHEMPAHQKLLAALRTALRPGGRLVIVEPISRWGRLRSREEQEDHHLIGAAFVVEDLRAAGYEVLELREPFTERPQGAEEWLLIARPRDGAATGGSR